VSFTTSQTVFVTTFYRKFFKLVKLNKRKTQLNLLSWNSLFQIAVVVEYTGLRWFLFHGCRQFFEQEREDLNVVFAITSERKPGTVAEANKAHLRFNEVIARTISYSM